LFGGDSLDYRQPAEAADAESGPGTEPRFENIAAVHLRSVFHHLVLLGHGFPPLPRFVELADDAVGSRYASAAFQLTVSLAPWRGAPSPRLKLSCCSTLSSRPSPRSSMMSTTLPAYSKPFITPDIVFSAPSTPAPASGRIRSARTTSVARWPTGAPRSAAAAKTPCAVCTRTIPSCASITCPSKRLLRPTNSATKRVCGCR